MNEGKKRALKRKREEYIREKGEYLDIQQQYISGALISKKLGISEKTLTTLAEMGEFELGRIAGRLIVNKDSVLQYLNRAHLRGKKENEAPAYDSSGKINPYLTFVGEPHLDIPELKKVQEFAERTMPPSDVRNFIRHCDIGTLYHYRIGTAYKMSEDDWLKSLAEIQKKEEEDKKGRKPEFLNRLKNINFIHTTSGKKSNAEHMPKITLLTEPFDDIYYFAEVVMSCLGISERTLIALAQIGEFELGKINRQIIVDKSSLLFFLDRAHLKGREFAHELPAYDGSGNVKPLLTNVPQKHHELPILKKINCFTLRFDPPFDERNFIRHCDMGTFHHYRIGTAYKLSEEDWVNSLYKVVRLGSETKSQRGERKRGESAAVRK